MFLLLLIVKSCVSQDNLSNMIDIDIGSRMER